MLGPPYRAMDTTVTAQAVEVGSGIGTSQVSKGECTPYLQIPVRNSVPLPPSLFLSLGARGKQHRSLFFITRWGISGRWEVDKFS